MIAIWSGTGADRPFEIHPVRIGGDIALFRRAAYVLKLGQPWRLFEAMAVPGTVVDKLNVLDSIR